MRTYGRRLFAQAMRRQKADSVVTRDAVVWSVDTSNYYCLVKIQGSNTTIKAHYPRNWRRVEKWLKPGNVVRIRHKDGVQGYIEVIGHGRALPSPVEGDSLPPLSVLTDKILTGMGVIESDTGSFDVYVESGTYRIDGVTYTFTASVVADITMNDPAEMLMGAGNVMGAGTYDSITLDAPPAAGYGRYDLISVGIDGVLDYDAGVAALLTTEPTKPTPDTDHVVIGYIFVYGGMTEVNQDDIGTTWSESKASSTQTTSTIKQADGSFEFPWSVAPATQTPTQTITFSIEDQYGNAKNVSAPYTLTRLYGTVDVWDGAAYGSSASGTIGSSVIFTFQRDQTGAEEVTLFEFSVTGYTSLTLYIVIVPLDIGGNPV